MVSCYVDLFAEENDEDSDEMNEDEDAEGTDVNTIICAHAFKDGKLLQQTS